jgi:hypothetical protein
MRISIKYLTAWQNATSRSRSPALASDWIAQAASALGHALPLDLDTANFHAGVNSAIPPYPRRTKLAACISPYARDYVEGMWRILQHPEPYDYVLATGETHSVRKFVDKTFAQTGIRIEWSGLGVDESGIDARSGRVLVTGDHRYFCPTDVDLLIGDVSKARSKLGW